MKVKVTTTQGGFFDFDAGEGFVFSHFVGSLKLNQHWMQERIFVPYHSIASVIMYEDTDIKQDYSGGMVKQ